jgi:tRNA modification GTPase
MQEAIVAIATPTGEGAIGIVRLSGKDCISLVDNFFPARTLVQSEARRAWFGILADEEGRVIDEVVLTELHGGGLGGDQLPWQSFHSQPRRPTLH